MRVDFRWLMAAVLVAVPALAADSARRGVTAEDYFAFESVGDAHISPDGKQVESFTRTPFGPNSSAYDWVIMIKAAFVML